MRRLSFFNAAAWLAVVGMLGWMLGAARPACAQTDGATILFSMSNDSLPPSFPAMAGQAFDNALGGAQSVAWDENQGHWGRFDIQKGIPAEGETLSGDVYGWGGTYYVIGSSLDPAKIYRYEADVHPPSSYESTGDGYNGWCGFKFYGEYNSSDPNASKSVWDTKGVSIRVKGNGRGGTDGHVPTEADPVAGFDPNTVDVYYNNSEDSFVFFAGAAFDQSLYNLDAEAEWLHVAVEFTGQGTTESPLLGKVFVYTQEVTTFEITDLGTRGTQIGFSHYTSGDGDYGYWTCQDNLMLSEIDAFTENVNAARGWTLFQ